jgi:predicted dehydrogenase
MPGMSTERRIGVVVAGCGAWGRNLVRTFNGLPGADLRGVCDLDPGRLDQMARQFPGVATSTELSGFLADPTVEAVVIAASAPAHKPLALAALAAGKHTYVEKPLALSTDDAQEIVDAARKAQRTLMVGHLLLYHPAVLYLKRLIDEGDLGELYYVYSQRVNLGVVRKDENALWSFGPHDVSVMNFLMGGPPENVTARGHAYLQPGVEDVVFVNLRYPGGRMGQIQLSWLDPHKLRSLTLVGSKKMAVFDDMSPAEKVRIYDKGAQVSREYATFGEYLGLRHGDVVLPRIDAREPLAAEGAHFLDAVRNGATPRTDGAEGLAVVRVLEAASRSLAADGSPVEL